MIDPEPDTRWDRIRTRCRRAYDTGRDWLADATATTDDVVRTFRFKAFVGLVGTGLATLALLWVMWTRWYGPLSTVVYAFVFVFGLALLPVTILLLGNALPGSGLLGKLHIIFAHIALRYPYLLDRGDRYEYAPGTKNAVWIDSAGENGEYREITSGHSNRTVLGWRPFGIVFDKTSVDLENLRADTVAERSRSTDGGTVERGGYQERAPPGVSGRDGKWLIDLKRVFSRGVKKLGDIDVLETTEEVTQRKQSQNGRLSGYRSIIGTVVGLLLGVSMAWFMLGGV